MIAQISNWELWGTALTAGIVAAFNPCGFAMLPAYLSYFIGLKSDDETSLLHNIRRALAVAIAMTAGFVLFFGLVGILTSTVVQQGTIFKYMPWVTLVLAVFMIILGIAMVFGFEPTLQIPRWSRGSGKSRDLPSIFFFGVSYAIVSLGCTAPLFLGVTVGSFSRSGILPASGAFLAYALGMGLVITVLTLATAIARQSMASVTNRILPWVSRISGVLLVLTGIFMVFWARWEIAVLGSGGGESAVTRFANEIQAEFSNWVSRVGGGTIALGALLIIGIVVGIGVIVARRSSGSVGEQASAAS